jgi:8-oxo-dGTP diphosphatase
VTHRIPKFGTLEAGAHYILRPGGYALVFEQSGKLAVVSTREGTYLPGGGQEPGESPEAATVREVAEECGLLVSLIARVGVADELVSSHEGTVHYRKRCTFFRARVVGTTAIVESDHVLSWVSPGAASRLLRHESHRWAVRKHWPRHSSRRVFSG